VKNIPRQIEKFPDDFNVPDRDPNVIEKVYKIIVITPLFGGGVEAGYIDPEMPIRSSSIRGHLRFWWRITRGKRYTDLAQLKQREGEIWGSQENPSPISIEVDQPDNDNLEPRSSAKNNYGFSSRDPQSYVLFPAKDKDVDICKEDFTFTLKIRWLTSQKLQLIRENENAELIRCKKTPLPKVIEDIGPDVEIASKAWVNFGGIGARTRRGCGALYCKDLALNSLKTLGTEFPFTILSSTECFDDTIAAWSKSIDTIKCFRQQRSGGPHRKNIGYGAKCRSIFVPEGRSKWPEPDSIRKITGCALTKQEPNPNTDHSKPKTPTIFFPRAELGLPIIFHFADGPGKGRPAVSNRDPPTVTLIPTKIDEKSGKRIDGTRMASPVITRPIVLRDDDKESIFSILIVLPRPTLPPLRLTGEYQHSPKEILKNLIVDKSLIDYNDSPLGPKENPRSPSGSALEAFIAFAQEEGRDFIEVSK
jgi:CRISPR-associated protein Cmr1